MKSYQVISGPSKELVDNVSDNFSVSIIRRLIWWDFRLYLLKTYSQFPTSSQSKGHCVDSAHRQVSHHSPHDLTLTLKDNCCHLSTIPVPFDAPTLLEYVDSQVPYITQDEPPLIPLPKVQILKF